MWYTTRSLEPDWSDSDSDQGFIWSLWNWKCHVRLPLKKRDWGSFGPFTNLLQVLKVWIFPAFLEITVLFWFRLTKVSSFHNFPRHQFNILMPLSLLWLKKNSTRRRNKKCILVMGPSQFLNRKGKMRNFDTEIISPSHLIMSNFLWFQKKWWKRNFSARCW